MRPAALANLANGATNARQPEVPATTHAPRHHTHVRSRRSTTHTHPSLAALASFSLSTRQVMTEEKAAFFRKELASSPATFIPLSRTEIDAELDRRWAWACQMKKQGRGDSDATADDDAQEEAAAEEEEEEVCAAKPLAELHAAVVHTHARTLKTLKETHTQPSCRLAALTHSQQRSLSLS